MSTIRERGFSLPEVLVALTITAMALVAAATFLAAHARATRRLEVRERLLRTAEVALESVRGRAVPLEPGLFDPGDEVEPAVEGAPIVVIDVRSAEIPGLYRVESTARDEADGAPVEVRLETLVWRP